MMKSPTDSTTLRNLMKSVLINQINSREMFMKGIDYSCYCEGK